jgi:hypothetical protein
MEQLLPVRMRHIPLIMEHLLSHLTSWTLVLGLVLFTHTTDACHLELVVYVK